MRERGSPLLEPIERGNPLLELTREPCKMEEKRPVPRSSIHILFTRAVKTDLTVQPVVETNTENVPDGCQTRSCHESRSFSVGNETTRAGTGQPVVNHDESSHEQTMLNEVNMDFRILGLPYSVVKQVERSRVRELVKKIGNHPDRHALQLDQQQNEAYNPFCATSSFFKKQIHLIVFQKLLGWKLEKSDTTK